MHASERDGSGYAQGSTQGTMAFSQLGLGVGQIAHDADGADQEGGAVFGQRTALCNAHESRDAFEFHDCSAFPEG